MKSNKPYRGNVLASLNIGIDFDGDKTLLVETKYAKVIYMLMEQMNVEGTLSHTVGSETDRIVFDTADDAKSLIRTLK